MLQRILPVLLLGSSAQLSATAAADPPVLQAFSGNPHYLAWGGTPIFPLGAAGFHIWTPVSRPGTMDFQAQLEGLAQALWLSPENDRPLARLPAASRDGLLRLAIPGGLDHRILRRAPRNESGGEALLDQ